MNRSRLLMIGGLALAVGLLVSFTVYTRLRTFTTSNTPEHGAAVVVAANDIPVGVKVTSRDLRVITLPQSAIPPGSYASISKVVDRGAVLPISKGETATDIDVPSLTVTSTEAAAENARMPASKIALTEVNKTFSPQSSCLNRPDIHVRLSSMTSSG